MDCIFCRIARGEIAAQVVLEDEETLAFRDLNPVGPHHVLVIPKRHVASLAETGDGDRDLLGRCLVQATRVARELGLESGYRVVVNTGAEGGQTVPHLHLHVIGGRAMTWPPG